MLLKYQRHASTNIHIKIFTLVIGFSWQHANIHKTCEYIKNTIRVTWWYISINGLLHNWIQEIVEINKLHITWFSLRDQIILIALFIRMIFVSNLYKGYGFVFYKFDSSETRALIITCYDFLWMYLLTPALTFIFVDTSHHQSNYEANTP